MAQLEKGRTFNPGDTVEAADLNLLVDGAEVLIGLITEQGTAVSATGTDQVLINRGGVFKRANVSSLPQGVTTVSRVIDSGASVLNFTIDTPSTTPVFHIGLDDQDPNEFLAGPVSGSATTPTFRAIKPADTTMFREISALTIDCTLGNVFRKQLTTDSTLRLNNGVIGQRITVYLIQNGGGNNNSVTWTSDDSGHVIRWPGGTDHTMSTGGLGVTDIVNFLCMGSGLYYGTFDKNFLP